MRQRAFDLLLAGAVVAFAFLASSFAVRNSDFWLHLASGRLLAEGRYAFGVDPFAFTTDNLYWANHAWLFDWFLFVLREHFGDAVLVVSKALLVSLLAAILMSVRRPGSGMALPAAGTLLAILALSLRLWLHSMLLSYFFLGLTLWLLWRPSREISSVRQQVRCYAPVLLVFVLWANLDSWFLLGPLLAALFWLGDALTPARTTDETRRHTPVWLAPVGLAVCLLNPYHLNTALLPVELTPLPAALRHDVAFETFSASPWRMSLYYHPLGGLNLAGSAYLVLLALGALSFVLNGRRWSGWRLLVWLTFAGLSAWLVRAMPFFAVVAGPIAVLNGQDFLRAKSEISSRRRRFIAGTLYLSLLVASLALIGLAWPGWLQGFQETGHHVAWSVQPDGSLRRVAQQLQRWRKNGRLPADGRGFLSHPNLVHYCAWFCPEEKGFLDPRLSLFRAVAGDYEDINRAVNPGRAPPERQANDSARRLLRKWGITHVVLYDHTLARLDPALKQLAEDKGAWTLLDIDGQALILGWRDGEQTLPSGVPIFAAERRAFAPPVDGEARSPDVPGRGPQRGPRDADFWSYFGPPPASSSWKTDAAGVLLRYFEARAPYQRHERTTHCFAWSAALLAAPASSAGFVDGPARLMVQLERTPLALDDLTWQSPALPLLAVRAARCAIAENPDDAAAYLRLGRAYLDLAGRTPERVVYGALPPLARVRHMQIAAALENACKRQPDLLPAHDELAALYEGRGFLDAALDHRRAALSLARRAGSLAGEGAPRLEERASLIKTLERRVGDLKNEFMLSSRNLGSEPTRKAQLALRMGLARLALEDVLMPSSIVLLGGEGIRMQVELQLMLGRSAVVREELHNPDWQANKDNLGLVTLFTSPQSALPVYHRAYDWLLLCQSAADGDYEQADAAAALLIDARPQGQETIQALALLDDEVPRGVAREMALSAYPASGPARALAQLQRQLQMEQLFSASLVTRERGDLNLLRGLLALERGEIRQAEEALAAARTLGRISSPVLPADGGAALANTYLQFLDAARR
jgi:hypothetical protein